MRHVAVGVALHSETLETIVALYTPQAQSWLAAPAASIRTAEPGETALIPPGDLPLARQALRHRKGGTYTRLATLRSKDGPLVVYASHADGTLWARPQEMFEDGRFESSAETPLTVAELGL